jgi:hypothetical protein
MRQSNKITPAAAPLSPRSPWVVRVVAGLVLAVALAISIALGIGGWVEIRHGETSVTIHRGQ